MTIADHTRRAGSGRDIARTVLIPLAAVGTAAKPLTITEHEFGDETVIARIANPCRGLPGPLTEVERGVFQSTGSELDSAEPGGAGGDMSILRYISAFNVEN